MALALVLATNFYPICIIFITAHYNLDGIFLILPYEVSRDASSLPIPDIEITYLVYSTAIIQNLQTDTLDYLHHVPYLIDADFEF